MLKIISRDIPFWITCGLGFQGLAILLKIEQLSIAAIVCLLVVAILATRREEGQWQRERGKLLIVVGPALFWGGAVLALPLTLYLLVAPVLAVAGLTLVVADARRHRAAAGGASTWRSHSAD